MRGFSIGRATIGYDTSGIRSFINAVNINVVDSMIREVNHNLPNLYSAVDQVWVGASAEAFKNKLSHDSMEFIKALDGIRDDFESQFAMVASNVDEYDAAIAASILGESIDTPNYSTNNNESSKKETKYNSYNSYSNTSSNVSTENKMVDWWNNLKSSGVNLYKAVDNTLNRVGATIGTATTSILEGVANFGESPLDSALILGNVIGTPFYAIADGVKGIISNFTGVKYKSTMDSEWDKVKSFVAKDFVSGFFDKFYSNTKLGNYLKNESYLFNAVRGVGSGLGYTAGVVATSIAGLSFAGVSVGSAGAGVSAAMTNAMSMVGGFAGLGRGTEAAYSNGADTLEGLLAGTVSGAWEGLQFFAGGKISGINPLGNDLANVGVRIAADSATGALETPFQAMVDTIYKDGYIDENGNYVAFKEGDSYFYKYSQMFNDEGGFAGMGVQAAVGGVVLLLVNLVILVKL